MLKKMLSILLTVALLTACGTKQVQEQDLSNQDGLVEPALVPVVVEIFSVGDDFQAGEEGIIEVKVTQGEEAVADADEVLIEIWKKGEEENSINYEAENKGEGLYHLAHIFPEDGLYYVIAHVTARDMHVMPRKEFIIGEVSENEQGGFQHHHGQHDQHGHHEHHEQHHHASDGLSIHLMKPDILKAGETALWMVHLAEEDGQPLTEARVRFDYWQDGQAHTLVDATETVAGEYTSEFSFSEIGEFRVVVHIEKDDLHEHQETRVHVE